MTKRVLVGFVAGFVAVLVFHQGVLWILHYFGYVPHAPWPIVAAVAFACSRSRPATVTG